MKAGSFHDYISEVDCRMTRIPLMSGYAPNRWKKCLDVMILKKAGITHLFLLRTIVIFPVDCNFAFKYVGREMMNNAEKGQALASEQYGSRKYHRSIDLAVNKALTFDLLRQLKKPGDLCSNDAKSCYDLIGHPQASLAMQRCGVSKSIIKCLFSQLQNATHQVRTGYGDSSSFYGGNKWLKPYHGIGQGNGAGPAIWAVVSSPILNILRRKGLGCHFIAPFSSTEVKFSGYSFVDDTDLVIVQLSGASYETILQALQDSVDTWEGGLTATSGAIVPEKTFWFLIDFAWSAGQWRYKSLDECPGELSVNDINGNRSTLKRYDVSEAQETLGVFLAPDGNHKAQIKKMIQASNKWADAMRSGSLSRSDVRLSLISTIWRTLLYPLPALNLTKTECELIMVPILRYCLPAMGYCRNFPRNVIFAPTTYMGLGIEHLYTVQEILCIKDIIFHTHYNTDTGSL